MVHLHITTISLVLQYLLAPTLGQFTTTQIGEYCPELSTTSYLSACTTFFDVPNKCDNIFQLNELTACYCQQSVVDVGSSCEAEYSTCYGDIAAGALNGIYAAINTICDGTVLGGPATTSTASNPRSTSAGSNGGNGGSSSITPGPNPGASSSRNQATPTSAPSLAVQTRPLTSQLLLLVCLVTVGVLV